MAVAAAAIHSCRFVRSPNGTDFSMASTSLPSYEVSQKDPDKTDSIAVRYVISGSLPAEGEAIPFVIEVAAFVKVVDHKGGRLGELC